MRLSIAVLAALAAASLAGPAQAQDWCGFKDENGAVIKCGYSTLAECRALTHAKDGVCMPNPDFADRVRPQSKTKIASAS